MNNLLQKLMLGCSATAMFTLFGPGAQAQTAQGQQPAEQGQQPADNVETVTVSGSRITIKGYEAPTPVTVIDTEKLQSNGYANIADSVRQMPQLNSPPASFSASQGSGSPGTAGLNLVNLRDLGIQRTLVLFDGQRTVIANLTGGVDVTTLPSAVISSVNVVTGGASAAWGSDAVAGVVNFVIDKNITGFNGSIQGGETTSGLVRSVSSQAVWGTYFLGERAHLELAASYNDRPDTALLIEQKWYRGTYLVSNPSFTAATASATNTQFVLANNVGVASSSFGGLITSSPTGTGTVGVNGVTALASANALRGINFINGGQVQQVNFGNLTAGTLSNGGSLGDRDSQAPWQTLANSSTTYTLFADAWYRITDTIKASVQMNYGYFTGKGDALPFGNLNMVVQQDNAYLPASVRAAMVAGGITSFTMGTQNGGNFNSATVNHENYTSGDEPATLFNRRQLMRGVFTLDGTLGDDWSWNSYISHSQTRFSVRTIGIPEIANLTAAQDAVTVTQANRGNSGLALGSIVCRSSLPGQAPVVVGKVTASPGCVPLNSIGTGLANAAGEAYAWANNGDFENMDLNLDVFEASMQGKLPLGLPAGDIAVSFGFQYHKEAGKNVASPIGAAAGWGSANYSSFPSNNVNVREGFLEADVPVLKDSFVQTLDLNAAGRLTDYSTSGLVETWKLGLTSQVNEDIKLRTTWSVDIRSPTIQELFAPSAVNTANIVDPKTGQTVRYVSNVSGNPQLAPEVARTISGGVILTPTILPGFSVSVDWYNINLTGLIATISNNLIISTCTTNINDPLCSALVFGGANGALSGINQTPLNINSLGTSGMDIASNYVAEFWNGSWNFSFNASYMDQLTIASPGSAINDYAGVLGGSGAPQSAGASKWKGLMSANYKTGPYSFTTQVRWYGSGILNNTWNTGNLATAATRWTVPDSVFHVDPTAYLDLRASYDWTKNWQFYAAVDNVLDIPPQMVPPYSGNIQSNGGLIPTITQYDLLGREVRLGVRVNF